MTNMSFFHTTQQCFNYQKTVTRRDGWMKLKPTAIVQQIVKGQGLKKGEHPEKIHRIQIMDNRIETLDTLLILPEYGHHEMVREGFPGRDPKDFVTWYCKESKKKPGDMISRIRFCYYLDPHKHNRLYVPESVGVCPSCKGKIYVEDFQNFILLEDGTMACDLFTFTCHNQPDIPDRQEYRAWEEKHAQELEMPYIHRLPVDAQIQTWLDEFFRFEI